MGPVRPEFELVVVCTGNRARSPIAEGFLRRLLADLPVRVLSFGTLELTGARALPEALQAASGVGLDLSAHRARGLGSEDLSQADLVLGFERQHLATAVVDNSARPERTFSLPELVELIEADDPAQEENPIERARRTISRAHARRARDASAALAELADPLGQTKTIFASTTARIQDLAERLAAGLFGVR